MKNKILTAVFCACLVLFMITFSIGVPIYCRFLHSCLGERVLCGTAEIFGKRRRTLRRLQGAVRFKPCGYDSDGCNLAYARAVKPLQGDRTRKNKGAPLVALIVLHFCKKIEILSFGGYKAYFWSAIVAVALPVLLLIAVAIAGFDNAFNAFHAVFFPGKDNWQFYSNLDQIILVMPESFFMNCAIIIGVTLVAFSAALITADLVIKYKKK